MWLAVSQFGDGIWSGTRTEMNLARFGDDPSLFFLGGAGGWESILTNFDTDRKTELIIARQWGQAGTGGSQSGETGTELGLQIGRG